MKAPMLSAPVAARNRQSVGPSKGPTPPAKGSGEQSSPPPTRNRQSVGPSKGPTPLAKGSGEQSSPPPTRLMTGRKRTPSRQIHRLALHSAHVRHRRIRGTKAGDSDPAGRVAAARVPGLRLGRRGDRRPAGDPGAALPRKAGGARGDGDARDARGDAGHRAHALGDPRPPQRGARPSAQGG